MIPIWPLIGLLILESFAWWCMKRYNMTYDISFFFYAAIAYVLIAAIICFTNFFGMKFMGVANAYWNVFSTIAIAAVGFLAFSEVLSIQACLGIGFGIASIFLLGTSMHE